MATGEVELPVEVAKLLPDDPYQQLDLARKITSLALATRLSGLEARLGKLRHSVEQKDGLIVDLQQRVADAEQAVQRTNIRILKTTDDQLRLSKENEQLEQNILKLKLDVSKMESFRKSVVQSLRLDEGVGSVSQLLQAVGPQPAEPGDEASTPHLSPRSKTGSDEEGSKRMLLSKSRLPRRSMSDSGHHSNAVVLYSGDPIATDEAQGGSRGMAPRKLRAALPPSEKTASSPALSESETLASAKASPRASSPPRSVLESEQVSEFETSSAQAGRKLVASSPRVPLPAAPHSRPLIQMTNGKEFFRQARSRMSHPQFKELLNIIKELNSHNLSKEEALGRAADLFGAENDDLYTFLCRHLNS